MLAASLERARPATTISHAGFSCDFVRGAGAALVEAGFAADLPLQLAQLLLQPSKVPVRDVEEVARSAGRVEDDVRGEVTLSLLDVGQGRAGSDSLAPAPDDRRADDLHDVRLGRVVGAERPDPLRPERTFQKRAEDRWLDELPVVRGGLPEQLELVELEVDDRGLREQPAIGVRNAGVHPVLRPGAPAARDSGTAGRGRLRSTLSDARSARRGSA